MISFSQPRNHYHLSELVGVRTPDLFPVNPVDLSTTRSSGGCCPICWDPCSLTDPTTFTTPYNHVFHVRCLSRWTTTTTTTCPLCRQPLTEFFINDLKTRLHERTMTYSNERFTSIRVFQNRMMRVAHDLSIPLEERRARIRAIGDEYERQRSNTTVFFQ